MKPATLKRIARRGDRLALAIELANDTLLVNSPIGPALAALDETLTALTFERMVAQERRDDLGTILAGFHERLQTQAEGDQVLSLLHRIPDWKEPATFSFGPRRRLHDLEDDLLNRSESTDGGGFHFDPLAADDEMHSGFNGNRP